MAVPGDDADIALGFDTAFCQSHRLGSGSGFVQHRGVGNRHSGQITHHRLEINKCFQTALGDFCLVRGVGGVPSRIFQDVAQNHARRVAGVVALADEVFKQLVLLRQGFQFSQRIGFADRRGNRHRTAAGDAARHDAIHQRLTRSRADDMQHVAFVRLGNADMAGDKFRRVFKFGKRGQSVHRRHGG